MGIVVVAGVAFKRLGKKPVADADPQPKLLELEARLTELEERVDFTERALTDVRARAQIPPNS
jgi:tetrahydromethanopterin S-methyltransferase subunit G